MKCVTDIIESGAVVDFDPDRVQIQMPDDFELPAGGLNIRWPDNRAGHGSPHEQLQVVRGAGLLPRQ